MAPAADFSVGNDYRQRNRPLLALSLTYLLLISAFMIWRGISVSPDYLLLLLLPVVIAIPIAIAMALWLVDRRQFLRFTTTQPGAVSPYYAALNSNPVAAFPSLHAAFPFIGFLATREVFARRASLVVLGWCGAVWFSVVNLGEHYVVDMIAGVALAAAAWWVLNHVVAPRCSALRATASVEPRLPTGMSTRTIRESLVTPEVE